MDKKDQDARNRILTATKEILDESDNFDQITVRQIAERANVGVGLIILPFLPDCRSVYR